MIPRNHIIPIFVPHLGCPFSCVFCNQNHITGQQKPASASDVTETVESALEKIPEPSEIQIAFYGGSFTAIDESRQTELLEEAYRYIEDGRVGSIRLSTRPDFIDEEVLNRLRKYGVTTIELGAQSMDDEVLRLSGRGHAAAQTALASKMIRDKGFELVLQFMTGLPGDTIEKTEKTAERIAALRPSGVRIYPTVIIKDTMLYSMWKSGKYREHTVQDAVDFCSRIVPLFIKENIPIIRLGLNPTEELSAGEAVGGAYHPALGELVYSRCMRDQAEEQMKSIPSGSDAVIRVNPSNLSKMIGQHRDNVNYLKEKYLLNDLEIRSDAQIDVESLKVEFIENHSNL